MTVITTSRYGHDICGSTANRPTNAEAGFLYYDTDIGVLLVWNVAGTWVPVSEQGQTTTIAAGSSQTDAAAMTTGFNLVTGGDGAKGVKLTAGVSGIPISGYNDSASNLYIYPPTGGTINDGSTNASVTVAAHTAFNFVAVSAGDWTGTYAAGGTYATLTGTEELTNKTITSQVVKTGLTASGSASNDFSGSTGTFKTSSGANQLTGATTIADATTPSLTTAAGSTNTGFVQVNGKTSGSLKVTTADATAQAVTLTVAAQTTGAATVTIPDQAGTSRNLVTDTGTQTLTNKTLTAPVLGAATGTSLAVTAGLTSSGATGTGIGYATGAGGTVSQATDRTTGVTLSKLSGQITTQATSLAAGAQVTFTVTNTTVAINDVVVACIQSGPTAGSNTFVTVSTVAAGSFNLTLCNPSSGTADTAAAIINFVVHRGVAA